MTNMVAAVELQRAEMRMVRWMCGVKLQDKSSQTTATTVLWPPGLSGTTLVSRYQKAKTRKVKPIWIY